MGHTVPGFQIFQAAIYLIAVYIVFWATWAFLSATYECIKLFYHVLCFIYKWIKHAFYIFSAPIRYLKGTTINTKHTELEELNGLEKIESINYELNTINEDDEEIPSSIYDLSFDTGHMLIRKNPGFQTRRIIYRMTREVVFATLETLAPFMNPNCVHLHVNGPLSECTFSILSGCVFQTVMVYREALLLLLRVDHEDQPHAMEVAHTLVQGLRIKDDPWNTDRFLVSKPGVDVHNLPLSFLQSALKTPKFYPNSTTESAFFEIHLFIRREFSKILYFIDELPRPNKYLFSFLFPIQNSLKMETVHQFDFDELYRRAHRNQRDRTLSQNIPMTSFCNDMRHYSLGTEMIGSPLVRYAGDIQSLQGLLRSWKSNGAPSFEEWDHKEVDF